MALVVVLTLLNASRVQIVFALYYIADTSDYMNKKNLGEVGQNRPEKYNSFHHAGAGIALKSYSSFCS